VDPLCSVIVPTLRRPAQLAECLAALAELDYPGDRYEVIVVDDGGDVPLESVLAPFRDRLRLTLLAGRHAGPAAARNAGAARAQGELLVFTDDDCRPRRDWLRRLADRHAAQPADGIGGSTVSVMHGNPYAETSQLVISVGYEQNNADETDARFFASNNLAFPARAFREVGGFDESFRTSEDRELCSRWVLGGRRFNVIGGKSSAARAVDIGWRRWLAFGYCMLVIFASVILPLIILLRTSLLSRWGLPITWQNLTLKNYAAFADTGTIVPTALLNSTLVSAVTASACVVLALVIVWIVERTRLPGRGLLTFTSTVTFAFPGVALAVGFVLGYGGPTLALFGTIWLFFIAFTAHRFPFAFMFMRNSVKQLSSEMEEAARVAGASWVRSIVTISAPLLKSGIVAAWMIVFAVTLRELSMAILLYVPGMETLPVAIYSFIDNGTFEIAAAVSVVLILLSIASMLALRWITGKAQMEL